MSRQDVTIEIAGKIDSIDVFSGLAQAALDDSACLDWNDGLNPGDGEEAIVAAAALQRTLFFCKSDTSYALGGLREFCREHGLSYLMSSGETGCDDFNTLTVWRPGMTSERDVHVNGRANLTVPLSDLKNATSTGLEAVNELIRFYDVDFKRESIAVGPAVLDIWEAENEMDNTPTAHAPGR